MRTSTAVLTACFVVSPMASAATGVEPEQVSMLLPWFNHAITSVGSNVACFSDPPIVEIRVQGYAGFSMVPPNRAPAVGEVFYTHLVLSHPGNPCAGSAVGVELLLPAGVSTAASAADPGFCFMRTPANPQRPYAQLFNLDVDPAYGCPQALAPGIEGLRVAPVRGGLGGGWGMAQGFFFEVLIPLKSSIAQFGNNAIRYRINPDIGVVGYASVPLYVDDGVIFRSAMEDNQLALDICTVSPPANGC